MRKVPFPMNLYKFVGIRTLAATVSLVAMLLIAAACGGDDDDTSPEKTGNNGGDAPSTSNGGSNASASSGTFVIDGKKFDIVEIRRCEPFGGISGNDAHEDDLDVAARSKSGEYLNAVISNNQGYGAQGALFTQQQHRMQLSRNGDKGIEQFEGFATNNADNVWYSGSLLPYADKATDGSEPLVSAPFALEGNKLSGEMKVTQDWPKGATGFVTVSFNLEVPSKVGKC